MFDLFWPRIESSGVYYRWPTEEIKKGFAKKIRDPKQREELDVLVLQNAKKYSRKFWNREPRDVRVSTPQGLIEGILNFHLVSNCGCATFDGDEDIMVNTHNLDSYVDQIIVLNLASDVCEYLDPNLKLPHGIVKDRVATFTYWGAFGYRLGDDRLTELADHLWKLKFTRENNQTAKIGESRLSIKPDKLVIKGPGFEACKLTFLATYCVKK